MNERIRRIFIIDEMMRLNDLREGPGYRVADLVNEINRRLQPERPYTMRTIYNDLHYMMDHLKVQFVKYKKGKEVYYRYPCGFRIDQCLPLTKELSGLKNILEVVHSIKGLSIIDDLFEELPKEFFAYIVPVDMARVIEFDENTDLRNLPLLKELFHHIRNKQVLLIHYKPFHKPIREYFFHPWYLKEYRNRWYLFGYEERQKALGKHPLVLAIDRIVRIRPFDDNIEYRPKDVDLDDIFNEIIGVTHLSELPLTSVECRVSRYAVPYLQSKPLHRSQRLRLSKDGYWHRLFLELRPNYEFINEILSFRSHIVITAPHWLSQYFHTIIERMHTLYQSIPSSNLESQAVEPDILQYYLAYNSAQDNTQS